LRLYAAKHADSWYKYINGVRGRGLLNGSFYLITGCKKSKSWGIASFQDTTPQREFHLTLNLPGMVNSHNTSGKEAPLPIPKSHLFSINGPVARNQTTFIQGFKIALGIGIEGGYSETPRSPILWILNLGIQQPLASLFHTAHNPHGFLGFWDFSRVPMRQAANREHQIMMGMIQYCMILLLPQRSFLFLYQLYQVLTGRLTDQIFHPSQLIMAYLQTKVLVISYRHINLIIRVRS
jgi:hypothetical protein